MFWTKLVVPSADLLVEDLVADLAALGQAVLGEAHAEGGDLVAGNEDGVAFAADLEGRRSAAAARSTIAAESSKLRPV